MTTIIKHNITVPTKKSEFFLFNSYKQSSTNIRNFKDENSLTKNNNFFK